MIAHSDTFTPSPLRRLFCSLLFVAAGIAALGAIGSSRTSGEGNPTATANKVEPWVIEHTANDQQAELMVVLVDQADLRPAADLATKNEKSRYVHDALWSKSQATQEPILRWLRERGLEHRSFYIINAILVKGSREVAEALAARPDVARVEGNPQIQNVLPQPITAVEAPSQPETPNAIEPNINYTHAPQVWARGFAGKGLVIGSADTGVRWTHNALKRHYRGWSGTMANHNYNWHDSIHYNTGNNPCGTNAPAPCDDNGHGTHTTGTAIGDDVMGRVSVRSQPRGQPRRTDAHSGLRCGGTVRLRSQWPAGLRALQFQHTADSDLVPQQLSTYRQRRRSDHLGTAGASSRLEKKVERVVLNALASETASPNFCLATNVTLAFVG